MSSQHPGKSGERDRKPGLGGRQGEGGPQGVKNSGSKVRREKHWERQRLREDRSDQLSDTSNDRGVKHLKP
jgi:hypothetical protein